MNTEKTNVEMKDAQSVSAEQKDGPDAALDAAPNAALDAAPDAARAALDAAPDAVLDAAPVAARAAVDADATEADVSEADLDQEDQERQPMTADGHGPPEAPPEDREEVDAEKNGSVKLKILDEAQEEEETFTGLNKEELLRVAGTPGWVRTRWTLLLVFWLAWLGMLVGAVLILLQAPRCRELPPTSWWNEGPLYQIGNIHAFTDTHNLKGVEQKMASLSQLKVKGLVLGPIHVAPPDEAMSLRFEEVSPEAGNLEQFKGVIQAARRKGICVVLDLTPNYQGSSGPWFSRSSVTNVAERLKSALVFWLSEGVDGVQLSGVEQLASKVPALWADIRAIVQNRTDQDLRGGSERLLLGVTESSSADDVSALLSSTGVDLLISKVLTAGGSDPARYARTVQRLYSNHTQTKLAWNLGGRDDGHLASVVPPAHVKLYQLLLLTLPGTPVFSYGDEIGLMDGESKFPKMLWDFEEELNGTLQEDQTDRLSLRNFFRSVSELRAKQRSLLHGDFFLLSNSSSSLAYLRVWDHNDRYLAAFNWGPEEEVVLRTSEAALPRHAVVALSTNSSALPEGSSVDLAELRLGPGQAALVRLPHAG
ncbi:4F2 cell-surface antigen heavy chain-like [Poeciliopsis prolifica]|uniref:4F2 cell-surface antigen heavy chain-like n=1 Tax=Poeciliopsis prolifica TaxID=188132 RepID=UPI0024140D6A|nr:4F2 cell-surface antigen heavy chain-like [Poeciliopsis prolifica]